MKVATFLVFAGSLACSPSAPEAAEGNAAAVVAAAPSDPCASAEGFADYRRKLGSAVNGRDRAALRALVSANIETDFGGGRGWQAFSKAWNLDRSEQSAVWDELAEVMRLGCRRDEAVLVMPALFDSLSDDVDPFDVVIATRSGAVWPKPRVEGAPLRTFAAGEVLTLAAPQVDEQPWVAVRASPTATGFARSDGVRSPLDYRALFHLEAGEWKLAAFLAGD